MKQFKFNEQTAIENMIKSNFVDKNNIINTIYSLAKYNYHILHLKDKANYNHIPKYITNNCENISEESIYMAQEAMQTKVESINEKIGEDGREIIDFLASEEDEQTRLVDKITVLEMIKKLNFRDREIIDIRYFKDKTQTQVAKILGISQVHVSRIEKKILNDFRNKLLV